MRTNQQIIILFKLRGIFTTSTGFHRSPNLLFLMLIHTNFSDHGCPNIVSKVTHSYIMLHISFSSFFFLNPKEKKKRCTEGTFSQKNPIFPPKNPVFPNGNFVNPYFGLPRFCPCSKSIGRLASPNTAAIQ